MLIAGDQGHVLQTAQLVIGAQSNAVKHPHKLQHGLRAQVAQIARHALGGLAHLGRQVDVQDGNAGLVVKIPNHGAARHHGWAMEAHIHLALEALAQQAVGDGGQVVDALADTDLGGAPARGGGSGVKVLKAGKHKAIGGLRHLQSEGFADHGLAVQGVAAVKLHGAHRHKNDVIVLQICLHFAVEHFGQDAGAQFHQ